VIAARSRNERIRGVSFLLSNRIHRRRRRTLQKQEKSRVGIYNSAKATKKKKGKKKKKKKKKKIMPRITCVGSNGQRGCGTVLMAPEPAAFVRCAVCQAITATATSTTGERLIGQQQQQQQQQQRRQMAAIQCQGCTVRLMFAAGATQVQCALCSTVNRVAGTRTDVSHCRCGGCGVTLMYTRGATSVSCGACHFVTNTAAIVGRENGEGASRLGKGEETLVVVENPPVKLRDGRIVTNVCIATEVVSSNNKKK
jgi:LSD1 subclass zinc finger protein